MIVEFTSDEGVERTGFTADYELGKKTFSPSYQQSNVLEDVKMDIVLP